jgi:Tol biopolymer transport system component
MSARHAQHLVLGTAVLVLSLAAAACDGDNPLAPGGADPAAPPSSAPGAETSPEFLTAGSGPRILFSSSRSGGWDLYRMASDGTGVVRVTSFSGRESTPAWSWDNKRIAFSRFRADASNVLHSDIYLMNADGTGKRWAMSQPSSMTITQPSWSPDNTNLAVVVYLSGIPRLVRMNVGTGAMSFINAGYAGMEPSFDPTGTKIVYLRSDGAKVEVINVDGTGHKVLLTGAAHEFDTPRFSPDGTRLAFTRLVNGNHDIYVRKLADGSTKRLTSNTSVEFAPTWSADGARIAFTSLRAGPTQIFTVSSAGGPQTRITHTTTQEGEPAWSH